LEIKSAFLYKMLFAIASVNQPQPTALPIKTNIEICGRNFRLECRVERVLMILVWEGPYQQRTGPVSRWTKLDLA
jgi:hypothetical protein